jgi:hypothetical protein
MGSLSQPANQKLFCPIRKKWVAALPEERIRQLLIQQMLKQEYPLSTLASEVSLSKLPHLNGLSALPSRRADLIVFCKNGQSFYPLLLIECKAEPLSEKVIRQIIGYNHYVKSYFLAIANQNGIYLGIPNGKMGNYAFQRGLPLYAELMQWAESLNL